MGEKKGKGGMVAAIAAHPEFVPQIVSIDIEKLEPNEGQLSNIDPVSGEDIGLPRNPRFIRDERFKALKRSITDDPEYLLFRPLEVFPLEGGKYIVVGGNQRLRACKELGFSEVPCLVFLEDTPMEKLRAWAIKDNIAFGDNDYDILANDWNQEELEAFGMELDWAAPGDEEESESSGERTEGEDDDYDIDQKVEERVHRGEIWALGPHRLMCGDSTDAGDVERLMGGEKADLWLTDPPYNVNYGARGKQYKEIAEDGGKNYQAGKDDRTIMNDNMDDGAFFDFLTQVDQNAVDVMKPGATFYICHSDSEGYNFRGACKEAGLTVRQCLIWKKDSLVLGRQDYQWIHEPILTGWKEGAGHHWYSDRTQTTVLEFDRPKKSELHPCLSPGNLVMTIRGLMEIGKIEKGMKVLSADGRFHEVEYVSRHPYKENIYKIFVQGTNLHDEATHNHPYLVARRDKKGEYHVEFIEAENVRIGDFLMTPHMKHGANETVTELDAWCYGLWLAQGSLQSSGHSKEINYPVFALDSRKKELQARLQDWGDDKKVSTYKSSGENGINVMVFDAAKGKRCEELCGRHAGEKVISEEVFMWSERLRRAFFDGYMAGDGCVIATRGHKHAKSISRALASQIKFIAESLGYKTLFYHRDAPKNTGIDGRRFKNVHDFYSTDFKLNETHRMSTERSLEYNGVKYWLHKVKDIQTEPYDGEVVNLSVEGYHTFQTVCGMTHNTMKPIPLFVYLIQNSSKKGDLVLDNFGGSGTTIIACEQTGRIGYTMELDEHYASVIIDRWEKYTGKQAVKIEG